MRGVIRSERRREEDEARVVGWRGWPSCRRGDFGEDLMIEGMLVVGGGVEGGLERWVEEGREEEEEDEGELGRREEVVRRRAWEARVSERKDGTGTGRGI